VKTVYLTLGSNVGDRQTNLKRALELLETPELHVLRLSSVYDTEPRDLRSQPRFLNQVVEAETSLFPMQLLKRIAKIERELGRKRLVEKGPRTIDIDILLFERFVVDTEELTIPHPRLHERRFVLEPLAELAPDLRHPVLRKSVRELLSGVPPQGVRKLTT
jgi:2-amino-4-hydroxy-6-hydroxymethyldihydropteridine diphosphokinase